MALVEIDTIGVDVDSPSTTTKLAIITRTSLRAVIRHNRIARNLISAIALVAILNTIVVIFTTEARAESRSHVLCRRRVIVQSAPVVPRKVVRGTASVGIDSCERRLLWLSGDENVKCGVDVEDITTTTDLGVIAHAFVSAAGSWHTEGGAIATEGVAAVALAAVLNTRDSKAVALTKPDATFNSDSIAGVATPAKNTGRGIIVAVAAVGNVRGSERCRGSIGSGKLGIETDSQSIITTADLILIARAGLVALG